MIYVTPKNREPAQRRPSKPKLCWVAKRGDPRGLELQAIKRINGTILVGIDVWRILDKHDYPSYEIEEFENEKELKKKYYFRKIRKHYFMDNPDPEERRFANGLL